MNKHKSWNDHHQEHLGGGHLRNQNELNLFLKLWVKLLLTWQQHSLLPSVKQTHPHLINKGTSSVQSEVGVSPGRLLGKFLQLYKLFDCGALSKEQFEERKQVMLDRLDELASN